MKIADFGLGGSPITSQNLATISPDDADNATRAGFFAGSGETTASKNYRLPYAPMLVGCRRGGSDGTGTVSQIQSSNSNFAFRYREQGVWSSWRDVYHTANTTKSSDGSLKAASPVARIANPDVTTRTDIDENDFHWCGHGVANGEARGIEITRDDVGVYRVTGAKSLATSGWRVLPPKDPDGSGDLGVVTAEQDDDEIIIKLFRRKMVLADGEIVIQPGEPIDVPVNSWIDIRLDMPESAIPPESLTE